MKGNASCYTLSACALISVLLLSGCAPLDWIKEQFGGKKTQPPTRAAAGDRPASTAAKGIEPVELKGRDDKVLVTLDGVPVMTIKSFEEEYEKLLEENAQLKQMAQFIPNLKENILNSLVNQVVMDAYVQRENIYTNSEYQADLARFTKSLERMLNNKYFAKTQKVTISDAEVRKFYDENKDKVPGLIVSQGGIRAVGVKFDSEAAAKDFADKVKGKSKQFNDIAKKEGLESQDFKLVNDQSMGMNVELRSKIMAFRSLPKIEMIKVADKEYWVVNATEKENKQYRPFDEVKEPLKSDLEREKEMKAVESAIEKLKGDYNVIIDQEAVKIIVPAPEEGQMAAQAEIPEEMAESAEVQIAESPEEAAPRAARAA